MKKFLSTTLSLALLTSVASVAIPVIVNDTPVAVAVTPKSDLAAPKVTDIFTVGFQMTWAESSTAHHYQIQISETNDFSKSVPQDRYNSRYSGTLVQNTTYYVRYRMVYRTKGVDTYSEWSKALKTKTKARFPGTFKSSSKRISNGAEITWTKSEFATKYRVVLADNKALDRNVKTWYTSNRKINVPLNSRDGQPKYVKVFSYNDLYMRHSDRIAVFPKKLAVAKGEQVKVVSQNLLCPKCTVEGVKNSDIIWAKRSKIHLQKIKEQNPGVLLLQEGWNSGGSQNGFYESLTKMGYGYDRTVEKNAATGYSNRVLYKTSLYKKVKSGLFKIDGDRRSAVWALLKSKKTGKQFYVVSTHPSPYVSLKKRIRSVETINTTMNKINRKKLSIIIGGDMNSSPNEATFNTHNTYIKRGWVDAGSAVKTKNLEYGTYMGYKKTVIDPTYGRIDYLYSKNTGGWSYYENVLKLKKGKIADTHGSDHNMIIGITTVK